MRLKVIEESQRKTQGNDRQILKHQIWLIGLSTLGVFVSFRYLFPIVFPFLIAYLIAKLIRPIVYFLNKRLHFPLIVSSIFTLVITLVVLGGGLFYLGAVLFGQLKNLVNDIPSYARMFADSMDSMCSSCDRLFGWKAGRAGAFLDDNMNAIWDMLRGFIMQLISEHTINLLIGIFTFASILLIIGIAVINLLQDYEDIQKKYRETVLYRVISPVTCKLGKVGVAYVKTQLTIMAINSVILTAGFFWMRSKYALLAGVGIAFMDAFPVIGSGLFLVPIFILRLLEGRYATAMTVLFLYILCEIVRSFIEPRMLGDRIGLYPFFTLMAMFVGFRLFGLIGFLAGPLGLIIIRAIVEEASRQE